MRRNRDSPSPTLNCLFVFESKYLAAEAYIRLRGLQDSSWPAGVAARRLGRGSNYRSSTTRIP